MRKTVKKYRNVQAKYRAVQATGRQPAGNRQATGRRTVAARQLKRLQPAQKLEERNLTLIASEKIRFNKKPGCDSVGRLICWAIV